MIGASTKTQSVASSRLLPGGNDTLFRHFLPGYHIKLIWRASNTAASCSPSKLFENSLENVVMFYFSRREHESRASPCTTSRLFMLHHQRPSACLQSINQSIVSTLITKKWFLTQWQKQARHFVQRTTRNTCHIPCPNASNNTTTTPRHPADARPHAGRRRDDV